MNEYKDKNGVWQPPDGIHFMKCDGNRDDENHYSFDWHTYRKDGEVVSHTDCWCTNI